MQVLLPIETDPGMTAAPAPEWRKGYAAAVSGELLVGLLVVALLPALFWAVVIAGVTSLLGYAASPVLLAIIAVAIAGFLANVFLILLQSDATQQGFCGREDHDFERSMPAYAPQLQRISRQTF